MIGQKTLLKVISNQIDFGEFPRFSIIVGPEGSGKRTLSTAVAFALGCQKAVIEPKVDSIREMIKDAYTIQTPTLYVIQDGNLSNSAKNAMLKICEETPKNAYIMMLVSDSNTLLDTIKSRAGMYFMQPYTPYEILDYAVTKGIHNKNALKETEIIKDLCETPGDVDKLANFGIVDFYNYVEKVVNNIASVSGANSFKIADSIDTKGNDSTKYDMKLFLKAFHSICGRELKKCVAENDIEGQMWFSAGIKVTSRIISQLNVTGINKGALFDIFVLDIRREWT